MSEQEKQVIIAEAKEIVARIKELVKKGNITKIFIKKKGETIVCLPLNLGLFGAIVGAAAAPWAMILVTLTSVGLDCSIELQKTDGTIVDINGKVIGKKLIDVGSMIAENVKDVVQNSSEEE